MLGKCRGDDMRRIIWNIYAWPITLFLIIVSAAGLVSRFDLLMVLDLAISLPSLVALHLHIWDRRFLPATLWKVYAFIFFLWDWLFELLLKPILWSKPFDASLLVFLLILLPLYIGVFRYAYRNWSLPDTAPEPN